MSDNSQTTVGDITRKAGSFVASCFASTIGVLVYLAMILYAEAHSFNMMSVGVNPDYMIWAAIGMVAVGLTAVALPVMLLFITKGTLEFWVGVAFYIMDLVLMGAASAIDFQLNATGIIPSWGHAYIQWILPTTPILVGCGWALKWFVSPSIQKRLRLANIESAVDELRINKMIKHASDQNATAAIDGQAASDAELFVRQTLGTRLTYLPPSRNSTVRPLSGSNIRQSLQRSFAADTDNNTETILMTPPQSTRQASPQRPIQNVNVSPQLDWICECGRPATRIANNRMVCDVCFASPNPQ